MTLAEFRAAKADLAIIDLPPGYTMVGWNANEDSHGRIDRFYTAVIWHGEVRGTGSTFAYTEISEHALERNPGVGPRAALSRAELESALMAVQDYVAYLAAGGKPRTMGL